MRVLADFVLVGSVYFLPFWCTLLLALVGFLAWSWYWEGVVVLIALDALYAPLATLTFSYLKLSIGSLLTLVFFELFVKKFMRGYEA